MTRPRAQVKLFEVVENVVAQMITVLGALKGNLGDFFGLLGQMKHISEANELKDKELGGEMKAKVTKLCAECKKKDAELAKLRGECYEKGMVIARHNDNNLRYNAMSKRWALAMETVSVLRGQVHQLMAETTVDKTNVKVLEQGMDGY